VKNQKEGRQLFRRYEVKEIFLENVLEKSKINFQRTQSRRLSGSTSEWVYYRHLFFTKGPDVCHPDVRTRWPYVPKWHSTTENKF